MDMTHLLHKLGGRWLKRAARAEVRAGRARLDEARSADERLLQADDGDPNTTISPGVAESGRRLRIPLRHFLGHGIIAGATGSGKTRAALLLMQQIFGIVSKTKTYGFGMIDLKGEFFAHALEICRRQKTGDETVHVLDLSHRTAVIPYDLLIPQRDESKSDLIARRMETLGDLLGDTDLSLRMSRMLRFLLSLLVENDLSFSALDYLVEVPTTATMLASKSKDDRVKRYFTGDFLKEQSSTLPALRYRLDPLIVPESVRLSLSAGERFDFAKVMDESGTILINLAGAGVHSAKIFQSLILSDLRQAIFARRNPERPFVWFCDEAQLLFDRRYDKANLATIFSLARSFGVHVTLVTQSLRSAIGDGEFFQNLETNFRWLLLLRSGTNDAAVLKPGLRATGSVRRGNSGGQPGYLTPDQELQHTLKEVANLPAREGFLWMRGSGARAVRITTHKVEDLARQPESSNEPALAERIRTRLVEEELRLSSLTANAAPSKGTVEDFLAQVDREYPKRSQE
jgi:hypothetical protein